MSTNTTPIAQSDEGEQPPQLVDGVLLKRVTVPAQPSGLWTLAVEDLTGYVRLKIRVGEDSYWRYTADGRMCTASGTRVSGAGCLCATAPMGALVGKLGGSNADDTSPGPAAPAAAASPTDQASAAVAALAVANAAPAAGGSASSGTFPVGTYCVIPVLTGYTGPLFLTMNDRPAGFEHHGGSLSVEIRGVANHRAE